MVKLDPNPTNTGSTSFALIAVSFGLCTFARYRRFVFELGCRVVNDQRIRQPEKTHAGLQPNKRGPCEESKLLNPAVGDLDCRTGDLLKITERCIFLHREQLAVLELGN